MLHKIRDRMTRAAVRAQVAALRAVARLRDEELGQTGFVVELILIGIALLLTAAIIAFWKAGGMTWLNNRLQSITQY